MARTPPETKSWEASIRTGLLCVLAVGLSVLAVLRVAGQGDYPQDAGPALSALLHGNLHAFGAAMPAMGALSLWVRWPFVELAHLWGASPLSLYRAGALPCVLSIGALGVWLAGLARRRGTGTAGQVAIVALAVVNPFVSSALSLGHPEELLTASLAIGAIVAASEQRAVLAAILLGLALAAKQWAVILVLPTVFALGSHRLRTLATAVGLAAVVYLPQVVVAPGSFLHNQIALAHERYLAPAVNSWLYLPSPTVTRHLHGGLTYSGHHLSPGVVGLLHPLIIGLAVLIAGQLARTGRPSMTPDQLCAGVALILLLRCTLDTETMPYYHAALFATMLAWDAARGERLPYRTVAVTVVGYLVFDRLGGPDVSASTASAAYVLVTVTGVALLGWAMVPRKRRRVAARAIASPAL